MAGQQQSRTFAALVAFLIAASAVGWLVFDDNTDRLLSDGRSTPTQKVTDDPAARRDALARDALERQASAISRGSQATYLAAWDTSTVESQQRGETTYRNLRALGVNSLDTRYVAAEAGLGPAEERRLGGDAWQAAVEITYSLRRSASLPARMTVSYTFVERGDEVFIVDLQAAEEERAPIWLFERLVVRRSERTVAAATTTADTERIDHRLRQAVRDLQSVVPWWTGTLVAYAPRSTEQLEAILAATPGSYDKIAAVTTTVDGSDRPASQVVIVVNARVFDRLGPIGSRVVITHEATHAATGAAVVEMPLWVAEGFADYVGVGAVEVPISVSARAVIRDVRRNGAPAALPDNEDFSAASGDLELAYEQAWLANRLIAKMYGERSLVRFYRFVVERPDDLSSAFRQLGTSEEAFTQRWRRSLRALASQG